MHTLTIIDVSCSETVQAIANCVGHLPDRERLVYQAISAGHKCRCLTEQMGVNKSRVHQILSNGCRRIGEHLNWRYLKTLYTDKEKRLCSIFFADQITEDILKNFNAIIDFLIEVCEVRNFYIEASRSRSKLVTQIKRHSIPGRPLRILAIIDGAGSDTDAYMDFRHIDAVVIGLLIKLYTKKYAHWKPRTVLRRFFVQDGSHYIFALPDDPSCRVRRLAPLEIASHKPCPLKFNPYLDRAYYEWLQGRRGIQKATGKYHAIWTRQNGRCAYCEQSMLPDQEVELVEIVIGQGRHIGNLQYIHRQCAYDVRSHIAEPKEHINLFSILDGVVSDVSPDKSPYLELRNYFRLSKKSPISLTFGKIETIIGDELSWEAHMYKSFWYDDEPGTNSPMWQAEKYPAHAITPSERNYCICDCWRSQGYEIKALHLEKKYVVFRRTESGTSGIQLPKVLTDHRLPDTLVYKFDQMVRQFIKENGL